MHGEWMTVKVIDEEGTEKNIQVHETHSQFVNFSAFCVMHRAKTQDDVCVVDSMGMFAPAPAKTYTC